MIPRLGCIIHYTTDADPAVQYSAIMQKVVLKPGNAAKLPDEDKYDCYLSIFYDTGASTPVRIPYSATYSRGHWTWPPLA